VLRLFDYNLLYSGPSLNIRVKINTVITRSRKEDKDKHMLK